MMAAQDRTGSARGPAPETRERGGVATVIARELLGERGLLRIDLDGELYLLRLTRNGKLILTK